MAVEPKGKKVKMDAYGNVAFGYVLMSAANTLTFATIQMAVGLFQGVAMLIHRVHWDPSATALREIVAATDNLQMALTTSNRLTAIDALNEPAVICRKQIVGIAANTEPFTRPMVDDFTSLPGGGKLVGANPLYVAMSSGGFAAAAAMYVQLDFTFVELSSGDYLELIQAQFPANI